MSHPASRYCRLYRVDDATLAAVRAHGESVDMQDVIEQFYAWVLGESEFMQFFPTQQLLNHVRDQQLRYWATFWGVQAVDEGYITSRRHIGEVHAHAKPRLSLSVYMAGMAEMVRLVGGGAQVQRLVLLDMAVVAEAYELHIKTMRDDLEALLGTVHEVQSVMEGVYSSDLYRRLQRATESIQPIEDG